MAKHRRHPDARQAAEGLARTAPLVSRWIERLLAGHAPPLTVAQFLVLQSVGDGEVVGSELARRAAVSPAAVSQLLAHSGVRRPRRAHARHRRPPASAADLDPDRRDDPSLRAHPAPRPSGRAPRRHAAAGGRRARPAAHAARGVTDRHGPAAAPAPTAAAPWAAAAPGSTLKTQTQSRRADSNRGPHHYE